MTRIEDEIAAARGAADAGRTYETRAEIVRGLQKIAGHMLSGWPASRWVADRASAILELLGEPSPSTPGSSVSVVFIDGDETMLGCPFCGMSDYLYVAEYKSYVEGKSLYSPGCDCCNCHSKETLDSYEDAVSYWNLRAEVEPLPRKPIEPLTDEDIAF